MLPVLGKGTRAVHVWQASLDVPPPHLEALRRLLSADERERAARFYFPQHRDRFTVGRGVLRSLLGAYLRCSPASIEFRYNPHGKPQLEETMSPLEFNVSHSEGLAVVALSWDGTVGIDIELIREDTEFDSIAAGCFAPKEYAELQALPLPQRRAAFFTGWTRKEAYLKGRGYGIANPLDEFAVSLAPGAPPRLFFDRRDSEAANHWSLHDLCTPGGFAGSLAVKGRGFVVHQFEYEGIEWPGECSDAAGGNSPVD